MTDADDDLLDLLEDNAVDFDDWRHDSEE
jgi:hypothetical protein